MHRVIKNKCNFLFLEIAQIWDTCMRKEDSSSGIQSYLEYNFILQCGKCPFYVIVQDESKQIMIEKFWNV